MAFITIYHRDLPGQSAEIDDSSFDVWKLAGWQKTEPKGSRTDNKES